MAERRPDNLEFIPSSVSPSDSWDDTVGSTVKIVARVIGENIGMDHPNVVRVAGWF